MDTDVVVLRKKPPKASQLKTEQVKCLSEDSMEKPGIKKPFNCEIDDIVLYLGSKLGAPNWSVN